MRNYFLTFPNRPGILVPFLVRFLEREIMGRKKAVVGGVSVSDAIREALGSLGDDAPAKEVGEFVAKKNPKLKDRVDSSSWSALVSQNRQSKGKRGGGGGGRKAKATGGTVTKSDLENYRSLCAEHDPKAVKAVLDFVAMTGADSAVKTVEVWERLLAAADGDQERAGKLVEVVGLIGG